MIKSQSLVSVEGSSMHPSWRIELLGELRAVHDGRVVTRFRSQKTALLLAYLAYHPHRPHRREQLCELLWPEGDPQTALANLRNTLRWLRQALEPPGTSSEALLVADRATLRLNPDAVTTDVAEFEAALHAAARAGSHPERAQCLTRAEELYRGELLAGCYDDWILQEREWLAERYFQALGGLIGQLEQVGDLPRALEVAHRGVSIDPLREEAHAELMRLYAASGQPAAALRQYSELERLLKQELAATPSAATRTLVGQIERQLLIRRPPPAVRSPSLPPSPHPKTAPPAAGENRLVTVLFADMRSSVETMRDLHPEDAAALVNRLLGAMVDALLKYEGQVDRFLRDGVLAVFGTLQVHEDDAERAIRAAIEIRAAAHKLGLEVTAGINTGLVYAGTVGSDRHQEQTVVGPVVNLAARLQEQAQPGQLLVGETTHYQSRRAFNFEPLSLAIQGLPQPVHAYVIGEALPRPEKARGIEGRRAELIGREGELARLREALAAVTQPGAGEAGGQMVSLIGEAGVGKSRLVAELKGLLAEVEVPRLSGVSFSGGEPLKRGTPVDGRQPPLWLEGRCIELSMTTGYSLFLDLLREYFAWRPEEPESKRVARLVVALRELVERGDLAAERAEEMGPLLGNLLSLRSGTDWDVRLKNASPEQIRHQTLLALQELFVALARRQPVVLLLEDLHWADPLSLDLISLLMEALPHAPLLLLCVYRPEREHRCWHLATIASRKCPERATELTLRELTPSQSGRLAQSLLGSEQVPASVTEEILRQAQGNPFFVEEVVHALLDMGTLYREGDAWRVRDLEPGSAGVPPACGQDGLAPSDGGPIIVPGSVQSVILSRVERLDGELRRVLESASVMGRLFRRRLLEQVEAPETGIERALWELEERGLIYQERVVPEEEYSFRHVLTQETIYGSLLRGQKAALHQKVGEAIECLYRGELEAEYEPLAYHYERSEAGEKAVEYLLKAGEKTRQAYLNEAAIGYFQRALERMKASLPDQAYKKWRLETWRGLGQTYHGIGKVPEAEEAFREAIAVGREIGLAPRELVRLYSWYADTLWWAARWDEMIRVGEEGMALLGEDRESVAAALMNDTIAMGHGDSPRGDREQWRECIYRNARFLDRLPYSEDLRAPYTHVSYVYQHDKNFVEAGRWLQALERQAKRHHDLRALSDVHRFTMDLTLAQGDLRESLFQIQQALVLMRKIGDTKHECICLSLLGRVFLAAGDLSSAEECASRLRDASETVGSKYGSALAFQELGVVLLCRGARDRAVEAFLRAARIHQELGRANVLTVLSLGRAYLARGEKAAARRQFEEAATLAETGAPLAAALSGLEEVCDAAEEFRAFGQRCQEDRDVPRNAALACPFLQPTEPNAFDQRVDDHSFAEPMASPWAWRDPFGDGACIRAPNGLEIHAATGRDLAFMNGSAPRLVQSARGGFAIQTVCEPVSTDKPAIGGLLLWKDARNYVRLDRGTRGPSEISFSGCVADRDLIIGRGRLLGERVVLRLERVGDRVSALCSANGQNWFTVGHILFPVEDPVEIGLHAIGAIDRTIYHGAYPDGTAIRFESVRHGRLRSG
jgi:DNA-binding SARP family transcriptional activator/class 3 adenylate cyclase